jgi:NAD(P)-dependent dehydrogenase (short-subunit alcohol dehydrogenase family)
MARPDDGPSDAFERAAAAARAELSLEGKSVLVTGGGAGLGRAGAALLAAAGARVALADVRPERVEAAVAALRRDGRDALGLVVDVSEPAQIERAIEAAVAAHGRLDVMVNAAGVIAIEPFLEVTPESYRRTMDVNVMGTFFGTQLAARRMIAQGPPPGRIVNVTSPGAETNSDSQTVYCMSKAAVNRITGGAAAALFDQHGICVVALKPYAVPSPMLQGIFERRERLFGLPAGEPARRRARELVHGRFEPIERHAEVLLWACAAPAEVVNGRYVTTVPYAGEL